MGRLEVGLGLGVGREGRRREEEAMGRREGISRCKERREGRRDCEAILVSRGKVMLSGLTRIYVSKTCGL